ncbi:MAG: hypothetical protein RPT95_15845 [Candidatus Sedimenticola sp. (ex Thyasira tokunagai)]
MRVLITLLLLVFLNTGCVSSPLKQAVDEFDAYHQVGQVINDFVIIGEKRIPIPTGNWVVLTKKTGYVDKNRGAIGGVILVEISGNAVTQMVLIKARLSEQVSAKGMKEDKHFNRADLHYVEKFSTDAFNRDYIGVHTAKLDASSLMKNGIWKDALLRLASEHNIRPPRRALSATFLVTKNYDFIQAQYIWNPDTDPRKQTGINWKDPDWEYPLFDADQKFYANKIVAWAKGWHPLIKKAIHRIGDSSSATGSTRVPGGSNSVELKLLKLKNLFDKGLITEQEYKEQKAMILAADLR